LLAFPAGKHDDIVDALGLIGQLLDRMMAGEHPATAPKPENASGYRRHEPEVRANHLSLIG
jgi:hypothetical protein